MKQKTLKSEFSVEGKGLHTGLELTASFHPAPDYYGYKIQRVDLDDRPILEAVAENVGDTRRGTVLGKGNRPFCGTIEHAMAALYALGVDNVLIRVNVPELPILDGSAKPYVDEILRVGTVEQECEKEFLCVGEEIKYEDAQSGSVMVLVPSNSFSVDCLITFDSELLDDQVASLTRLKDFVSEIAPARTFVFVHEIEPLLSAGLIKGGDLDNAVVIYDKEVSQESLDRLCELTGAEHHDASEVGYLQHKPLGWYNEPARHKLLDILGDLALIGRPIRGRILATKPGHTVNNKFARKIRERFIRPYNSGFDEIIEFKNDRLFALKNLGRDFFLNPGKDAGIRMIEALTEAGKMLMSKYNIGKDKKYHIRVSNIELQHNFSPKGYVVFEVFATNPLGFSGQGPVKDFCGVVFQRGNCVAKANFSAELRKK